MRVSLSGTYSTGKTTLAEAVVPALQGTYGDGFAFIPEVARTVIHRGFGLDRDATIDSYVVYIQLQLEAERRAAAAERLLSDRSLMDLLAYIRFNDPDIVPVYVREMLEEVVWMESRYFDVYAYLPIEFPLETDGVRPDSETYRADIDRTLCDVFREYGVRVERVTGPVSRRADRIRRLFEPTP